MESIILFIHIIIAVSLIGLILLQQGKGAQMGAAFGSGASNTLFGSRGPAGFLMKLTGTLIALFFITSITLGRIAANEAKAQGQLVQSAPVNPLQHMQAPVQPKLPAIPQQPVQTQSTSPAGAPSQNSQQVPVA